MSKSKILLASLAAALAAAVISPVVSYQAGYNSGAARGGVPHVSMKAAATISAGDYNVDHPAAVSGDRTWELPPTALLTAGEAHTCSASDSYVRCWGWNAYGQSLIPSLSGVLSIAAGTDHTCAVVPRSRKAKDGLVRCWGGDYSGQSDVPADLGAVREVAAGAWFTCALTVAGRVRCWGNGSDTTVPADLAGVRAVSLGAVHACALLDTEKVRCWKATDVDDTSNDLGQFHVPADLGPAVAVSAGPTSSCAVLVSRLMTCWGDGAKKAPSDLVGVVAVSNAACALTRDGAVRCWDGREVPGGLGPVRSLAAGEGHTCALLSSTKVRCWGDDRYWQLG